MPTYLSKKPKEIPTGKLKARIEELCITYGTKFIETEQACTSKTSFLDDDLLPKYGEKPERHQPSGKRVKGGLYKTRKGRLMNADSNAAANVLRKVAIRLELDLSVISRGALTTPLRVHFWTA